MQVQDSAARLETTADLHKRNGRLPAFDYHPRTRVVFGPGKIAELGILAAELGARSVLLVTDHGLETAGHPQKGIAALESAGLRVPGVDQGQPEPPTPDADARGGVAPAPRREPSVR